MRRRNTESAGPSRSRVGIVTGKLAGCQNSPNFLNILSHSPSCVSKQLLLRYGERRKLPARSGAVPQSPKGFSAFSVLVMSSPDVHFISAETLHTISPDVWQMSPPVIENSYTLCVQTMAPWLAVPLNPNTVSSRPTQPTRFRLSHSRSFGWRRTVKTTIIRRSLTQTAFRLPVNVENFTLEITHSAAVAYLHDIHPPTRLKLKHRSSLCLSNGHGFWTWMYRSFSVSNVSNFSKGDPG